MQVQAFHSKIVSDNQLANYLFKSCEELASKRQDIIIALSGGSTPIEMYRLFAKLLKTKVLKAVIHLIQVDERFVPKDGSRSNQKMIRDIFGSIPNIKFHPMQSKEEDLTLEKAVELTTTTYQQLFARYEVEGPDITILGMGTDGHTASHFPQNPTYIETFDTQQLIIGMYVDVQKEERISLTRSIINTSPIKILYAYGKQKLETLRYALQDENPTKYPILGVVDDLQFWTVIDEELLRFDFNWYLTNDY